VRLWVARRLFDYSRLPRLPHKKDPGARPWVLQAASGAGAWIDPRVIEEPRAEVDRQENAWGPLLRRSR
jgi:hypothetical protein